MTSGRPAGKPRKRKREVEGGPKKKAPSALGARRRLREAPGLCLALCGLPSPLTREGNFTTG